MAWEEIKNDVTFWKPDVEGAELVGKIVDKRQGDYGFSYTIENDRKEKIVTPSHKVLQNRMAGFQIGDDVKIVFNGTEAPKVKGQNRTMLYSVFKKR